MNESGHKTRLVKAINSLPGARARRVEDRYAVGALDMIIKLPGFPMIVAEGKIIDGNFFGPTQKQFDEGMKWIHADVRAVLIGWKRGKMFISPWIRKAAIFDSFTGLYSSANEDAQTLINFMERNPL